MFLSFIACKSGEERENDSGRMMRYLPGAPVTESDARTVQRRLSFIFHQMDREQYPRVLDIGIGHGTYLNHLMAHAKEFVGIDISEENLRGIRHGKGGTPAELLKMSAEDLGFPDASFDLVLLIDVFEHLADDRKVLSEMYRVLNPGGILIVTTPNKLFPFETHGCKIRGEQVDTRYFGVPFLPYLPESWRARYANVRVSTPWQLRKKLQSAGFRIRETGYIGPNFDRIRTRYPGSEKLMKIFQTCSGILDGIPLVQLFSTTIIMCAGKPAGMLGKP